MEEASETTQTSGAGAHGVDALLRLLRGGAADRDGIAVLTTTCGDRDERTPGGTRSHPPPALEVVRELRRRGKLKNLIAVGSERSLSSVAGEGATSGTTVTLIRDSAAVAALVRARPVDVCVVGADRVCANGDAVGAAGTYGLAVVSAAHDVPFFVATDIAALDAEVECGDDVGIEYGTVAREDLAEATTNAPQNVELWNPAFDVTPARYIAGIVTEKGVIAKSDTGTFDVASFAENPTTHERIEVKESTSVVAESYTEQTVESLPLYLAKHAPAAMEALGSSSFVDLDCEEIGDGNLNLVFVVTNTLNDRKVVAKQALPYVRSSGESWPLTLDRAFYEYTALTAEKEACAEFVPSLYYFSKPSALMVMEYIPPPNIILRKGLIAGIQYPTMAHDMGVFCAATLFKTSGFKLSATELRKKVEFWSSNSEMCALTEQVVFTEPYIHAANNRWTSPHLDTHKKAIEADTSLKVAAAKLKTKFIAKTEALLHADLHSGSIMCSPEAGQTFVIDPKFGFYGPMGFDTGAFIANLFLSYVSQEGHNNGTEYAEWILEQIAIFWRTFKAEFLKLWNDPTEHTGDKFPRRMFEDDTSLRVAQDDYMSELLIETLGFAGMKMLRRIVGSVHVDDLDSIEDDDVRASCEIHGLEIAKELIKSPEPFNSIESNSIERVVRLAREKKPIL